MTKRRGGGRRRRVHGWDCNNLEVSMAENPVLHLLALPLQDLTDRMLKSATDAFGAQAMNIGVSTTAGSNHLDVSGIPSTEAPKHGSVVSFLKFAGEHPYIEAKKFVVQCSDGRAITYIDEPAAGTRIELRAPGNDAEKLSHVVAMITACRKHFTFMRRPQLLGEELPAHQRESMRHYERALSDLTAKVAELGSLTAQQVARYDDMLVKKLQETDRAYDAKRKLLDEEHGVRMLAAEEREAAIKKRESEFDIRARSAVRRDLITKLEQMLEKQKVAKVSDETSAKRTPVYVGCGAGFLLAMIGASGALVKLDLAAPDWRLVTIGFVSMGFGIGIIIFFLRFTYGWFAELAKAELTTRKYDLDVIRANWLAELYLESKEQSQIDLPPELLGNLAQNLFKEVEWKHRVQHPLEQLIGGFGKIKKFKASELEIQKK